jgi:hypothetical protein
MSSTLPNIHPVDDDFMYAKTVTFNIWHG